MSELTYFYRVLPRFNQFYLVLPGLVQFYRVLPCFTEFYRVLPSFTEFFIHNTTRMGPKDLILWGFRRSYLGLPSFTKFYPVLPSLTQFNRVLPSFSYMIPPAWDRKLILVFSDWLSEPNSLRSCIFFCLAMQEVVITLCPAAALPSVPQAEAAGAGRLLQRRQRRRRRAAQLRVSAYDNLSAEVHDRPAGDRVILNPFFKDLNKYF